MPHWHLQTYIASVPHRQPCVSAVCDTELVQVPGGAPPGVVSGGCSGQAGNWNVTQVASCVQYLLWASSSSSSKLRTVSGHYDRGTYLQSHIGQAHYNRRQDAPPSYKPATTAQSPDPDSS